jgi:autotransporter-associated beta strand protein
LNVVANMVLGGSETAYFDLSATSTTVGSGVNDLVNVVGNLTLGGTTSVYINLLNGTALVTGGTYTLFNYGKGALGSAASNSFALADPGLLAARQTYKFDTSHAGAVNLDITGGPANLTWVGGSGAAWDNSGGTTTWYNNGTSQDDRFYAGDNVSFVAAQSGSVTIGATVQPGSVTVSGNYTFSGSGKITGATGLTVQSGATLVIANTNDYSGNTVIDQGTLRISAAGAIPSGSGAGNVVFDNAANNSMLNLNGLSLTIDGLSQPNASSTNLVVNNLSGTSTLSVGANNTSSTFAGILKNNAGSGGTLALTKIGAGMLMLSGSNAYTGATTISGGTLAILSSSALPAATSLVFTSTGGQLSLGAASASVSSMSFDNTATAAITGTITGNALTVTAGSFQLGSSALNGSSSAGTQTLNMSSLSSFVFNSPGQPFQVGGNVVGTSTSPGDAGVLVMAQSNTVTAAGFGVASASGSVYNGNDHNYGTVYLGQANTIKANTISVDGSVKGWGLLEFAGSLANPALTLRDASGGTTATLLIGFNSSNFFPSGGTIDLVSGVNGQSVLDAKLSSGTLGEATGTGNGGSSAAAVFNMGGGTLDVLNSLLIAEVRGVGNVNSSVGIFGGRLSAGTITLGDQHNTGTPSAAVTLDSGGTLDATLVQSGSGNGVRTFNWNNGSIANYNGSGGTSGLTVSIPTLTIASTGTHTLWIDSGRSGTIGSAIVGAGALTKDGAGTAILSGTNTFSGGTTVLDGTLIVTAKGALEDGSELSIGSNLSTFTPDAAVVPNAAASNEVTAAVPEPGTFILLTAVTICLCGCRKGGAWRG